jgi:hypothetical protein
VTVVIDSGVWISALQFGGIPLLAVETALASDQVAICSQILEEIERVLVVRMSSGLVHHDRHLDRQ